jgi:ABC-type branched-subunit amino acid transport system ATPase component
MNALAEMNQVISCRAVTKTFDGVRALDALDLDIVGTGVIAIIGPNGAGKSTLLDILTCRTRPDGGSVTIGGVSLSQRVPTHAVAHHAVARTFQELRLFRNMTVIENLMVARRPQSGEQLVRALLRIGVQKEESNHREKVLQVLDLVGLGREAETAAGELSYGQQKLIALAQCLATDAQVLLLDEPVAGVHPSFVEEIAQVLVKLGREGKLVIFVEHDISLVRQIAERVIVMDHGQVIADGNPQVILNRPEILEAYVG